MSEGSELTALKLSLMVNSASLQVKDVLVEEDQRVEVRVAVKFSLIKWLRNICRNGLGELGRDEDYGGWNFSKSLGMYEVYAPLLIPAGSEFKLLEMAITTMDQYMMISEGDTEATRKWLKIRVRAGRVFDYAEVIGL